MAQTALTVQQMVLPFEPVSANEIDVVFTAGDVTNGNSFVCTGNEVLIVYNSHATTAYTFTVTSTNDEKNRTGDIGPYSLAAGEFACVSAGLTNTKGWKQTSGLIHLAVENAAVKFMVLRLPAIRG